MSETDKKKTFLFDVKGTLIDDELSYMSPILVECFKRLKERGHRLGLSTAQSTSELKKFIVEDLKLDLDFFDAGIILEDGHVRVPVGGDWDNARIMTAGSALDEMKSFTQVFQENWIPAEDETLAQNGWGFLKGAPKVPIQLAPDKLAPVGSVTIWELDDASEATSDTVALQNHLQILLDNNDLTNIEVTDGGNGTLRVLELMRDKSTDMLRWGFNPAQMLFIGNGNNDISLAQTVSYFGGVVLAVKNSPEDLKDLADHVADKDASDGTVDLLLDLLER